MMRSLYEIIPCSEMMRSLYEIIHICTAVVNESEEVTGSNPVEALIFSGFFFPIA